MFFPCRQKQKHSFALVVYFTGQTKFIVILGPSWAPKQAKRFHLVFSWRHWGQTRNTRADNVYNHTFVILRFLLATLIFYYRSYYFPCAGSNLGVSGSKVQLPLLTFGLTTFKQIFDKPWIIVNYLTSRLCILISNFAASLNNAIILRF